MKNKKDASKDSVIFWTMAKWSYVKKKYKLNMPFLR